MIVRSQGYGRTMKYVITVLFLIRLNTGLSQDSTLKSSDRVLTEVPGTVDTGAHYLFYLHGRIIEEKGIRPTHERFGVYEYQAILDTLSGRGFVVISEPRPKGTDVRKYAAKVAQQISELLDSGLSPKHITVAGASKGALIAMLVSTIMKSKDVGFALMGGCEDSRLDEFNIDLWGNVLSIYESSDSLAGTCDKFFERATGVQRRKEIKLDTGLGHGFLYKPFNDWIDPILEWVEYE